MRGTWAVEKLVSGSYVSDSTIYRPNENFSLAVSSNQAKMKLADGSWAYVSPETKYSSEPFTFRWLEILETDTFETKIEDYVKNQNFLRITDHLSNTYTGTFIISRRVWIVGTVDTFDIEAVFDQQDE